MRGSGERGTHWEKSPDPRIGSGDGENSGCTPEPMRGSGERGTHWEKSPDPRIGSGDRREFGMRSRADVRLGRTGDLGASPPIATAAMGGGNGSESPHCRCGDGGREMGVSSPIATAAMGEGKWARAPKPRIGSGEVGGRGDGLPRPKSGIGGGRESGDGGRTGGAVPQSALSIGGGRN